MIQWSISSVLFNYIAHSKVPILIMYLNLSVFIQYDQKQFTEEKVCIAYDF